MIRFRSAALGAAFFLSIASVAGAQQGGGQGHGEHGKPAKGGMAGQRGAGMAMMLLRGIELTDAQKLQLRQIHERHVAERQALQAKRGEGRPDSTERAAMLQLAERHHAEVRTILTLDQQKTFDANVAAMRERRGGAGAGWQGGKRAPRVKGDSAKRGS